MVVTVTVMLSGLVIVLVVVHLYYDHRDRGGDKYSHGEIALDRAKGIGMGAVLAILLPPKLRIR